jgi:hypothetical protein
MKPIWPYQSNPEPPDDEHFDECNEADSTTCICHEIQEKQHLDTVDIILAQRKEQEDE